VFCWITSIRAWWRVIAVDNDRRWMLMRDMGPKTLDSVPGLEQWKAAVRAYAQLQVGWVDATRRFAMAGCPSRGLLQLVESVDRLLMDTVAMRPGEPDGLSIKQIHALHYRGRALKIAAHRLGTLRLPTSMDHGDFWAGQIVVGRTNPVFIDWSDASISHPFFSMAFFSDDEEMRPIWGCSPGLAADAGRVPRALDCLRALGHPDAGVEHRVFAGASQHGAAVSRPHPAGHGGKVGNGRR